MTDIEPRVAKLEALLGKVKARAAEPRVRAVAAAPAVPAPQAAPPAAPPSPFAPASAAKPAQAKPAEAAPAASVARPPSTVAGPPPSRRSHGALPAVSPPPRPSPSSPNLAAQKGVPSEADSEPETPVPSASPAAPARAADQELSHVRLEADPSADGFAPEAPGADADLDDATLIHASTGERAAAYTAEAHLAKTSEGHAVSPPAPASAPRAIAPSFEEEEDRRHTPPPESGKQKAPSLSPKRLSDIPRLTPDDYEPESRDEHTLAGVGGGFDAVGAKVTGSVHAAPTSPPAPAAPAVPVAPVASPAAHAAPTSPPISAAAAAAAASAKPAITTAPAAPASPSAAPAAAAPTGPSVYKPSLPEQTVVAASTGKVAVAEPRTLGELLDATLAL